VKTEKNILVAFLLNLSFAVFEFIGGAISGSVAIASDAVHDIGDAAGIGISFFLERKSKKQPDNSFTYGYARYSVLGSLLITLILLIGSGIVVYNAILRIIHPAKIDYNGMIIFAVIGAMVNLCAAWFTRGGDSLNQKAVNLHMLEDVLGWIIVLVGAIVMRVSDFALIDPIISIGVALFIAVNALKNLGECKNVLLEKAPKDIDVEQVKAYVCAVDGVQDVHHLHVWSMDGHKNYATLHVVTDQNAQSIKARVREALSKYKISHATLELEKPYEVCAEPTCHLEHSFSLHHHSHHHGHSHKHSHCG